MARNDDAGNRSILVRERGTVSGTRETVRFEWTIRFQREKEEEEGLALDEGGRDRRKSSRSFARSRLVFFSVFQPDPCFVSLRVQVPRILPLGMTGRERNNERRTVSIFVERNRRTTKTLDDDGKFARYSRVLYESPFR